MFFREIRLISEIRIKGQQPFGLHFVGCAQDRRRLNIAQEKGGFFLALSSACTSLATPKIGGALTLLKKKGLFLGTVFGLHYLCQLV